MEFIEGKNFKQLIEEGRNFDERLVRKFALQLCSAVQYLHSQEPPVIHSDIKPANVMLTPKGNICLIDFNISVFSGNGIGTAMGGSRGFAAPEQFRRIIDAPVFIDEFHEETRFIDSDETEILLASEQLPRQTSGIKTRNTALAYIDTRTDIYGIGATIYYLLTARIPVNGHTDFRGISCSKQMKSIIVKAMDPSPGKRFQSALDMLRVLMDKSYESKKAALLTASALLTALMCIVLVLNFNSGNSDDIEDLSGFLMESSVENSLIVTSVDDIPVEATTLSSTVSTEAVLTVTETAAETTVKVNTVNMPSLIGKDIDEAAQILKAIGLSYKITYSDKQYKDIGENCVYLQKPASGNQVKKDKVIELGVSTYKAEETVMMPSLIGKTEKEVKQLLDVMGLPYKITYSDKQYVDVGENCVYSQKPSHGGQVKKGDTVEIGVSTYKEMAVIAPTVSKKEYSNEELEDAFYELITNPYSDIEQSKLDAITQISISNGRECYFSINSSEDTVSDFNKRQLLGIVSIDINQITKMKNLKKLYMVGCNITNIDKFAKLTNLTDLSLAACNLSEISVLSNMTKLTHLTLTHTPDNYYLDITPLSSLTNLTYLNLCVTNIKNISPLSNLVGLTYLNLGYTNIKDISSLSNLTALETLILSSNDISDIIPLSNLKKLTDLHLGDNNISDITPLSNLVNLVELNLSDNNISDIASLKNLVNLSDLDLCDNNISDTAPIVNLSNLTILFLDDNDISEVTWIGNLTNLIQLRLVNNNISDISPLSSLINLRALNTTNNNLSDEDISVLQEALPRCHVENYDSTVF